MWKFKAEGKNGPWSPLGQTDVLYHFTVNNFTAIQNKTKINDIWLLSEPRQCIRVRDCFQTVCLITLQLKPLEEAMVILALAR